MLYIPTLNSIHTVITNSQRDNLISAQWHLLHRWCGAVWALFMLCTGFAPLHLTCSHLRSLATSQHLSSVVSQVLDQVAGWRRWLPSGWKLVGQGLVVGFAQSLLRHSWRSHIFQHRGNLPFRDVPPSNLSNSLVDKSSKKPYYMSVVLESLTKF